MSANQEFKIYNTHNNTQINKGDAIKVTSIPQIESFWVSIEDIKPNGDLKCKVQNNLTKPHSFNYEDIITITSKSYIREYKNHIDRFKISDADRLEIISRYLVFKYTHNREPTQEDYEQIINIRYSE